MLQLVIPAAAESPNGKTCQAVQILTPVPFREPMDAW